LEGIGEKIMSDVGPRIISLKRTFPGFDGKDYVGKGRK
jgi:hypothetical protein